MLILLPPSEGKAAIGSGRRLAPSTLAFPALNPARDRVLDALTALCERPNEAAGVLGLSPGQLDEIGRNTRLRRAPALPAADLYTGVLYEALDLATLGSDAREAARRSILIFSGLWGAVRIDDRIPPYRCSIGVTMPGLGGLGGYWRREMAGPLARAAAGRLVLDLRSDAYGATWSPVGAAAARWASVRVLRERVVAGVVTRTVVSHFNKATKGRLVRDMLLADADPRSPGELVDVLRDLKYTVELTPARRGRPTVVEVIV